MPSFSVCSQEACGSPVIAKGLCPKHYQRLKRHGSADYEPAPRPTRCTVPGCEDTDFVAHGYCRKHYRRWQMYGDPMGTKARQRVVPWCGGAKRAFDECGIVGCGRVHDARGLCSAHLARFQRHGDPNANLPLGRRVENLRRINKDGYVVVRAADGVGTDLEHRVVMAAHLGRPLRAEETVHHIHGNREDNRLHNLELWTKSHPSGQRVSDKVAWARELLALYEPGALR